MSLKKLILATTIASGLLVGAMPTTALADTAEQNQKLQQEIEFECTTGSYGQNSTCKATASQSGEQRQRIYTRDGVKFHKVLDTGLDTVTMATVSGILAVGATALVVKIKNRVA